MLATTTGVMPGSKPAKLKENGTFTEVTVRENIKEEIKLVEALELKDDTFFFGSHMLNLVRVSDRLKLKKDAWQTFLCTESNAKGSVGRG